MKGKLNYLLTEGRGKKTWSPKRDEDNLGEVIEKAPSWLRKKWGGQWRKGEGKNLHTRGKRCSIKRKKVKERTNQENLERKGERENYAKSTPAFYRRKDRKRKAEKEKKRKKSRCSPTAWKKKFGRGG